MRIAKGVTNAPYSTIHGYNLWNHILEPGGIGQKNWSYAHRCNTKSYKTRRAALPQVHNIGAYGPIY